MARYREHEIKERYPRVDTVLYQSFLPLIRIVHNWIQALDDHTLADGVTIKDYRELLNDSYQTDSPYRGVDQWEPILFEAGILQSKGKYTRLEARDLPDAAIQQIIVQQIRSMELYGVSAVNIASGMQSIQEQGGQQKFFSLPIDSDTAQMAELLGVCEAKEHPTSGLFMIKPKATSHIPTNRTQLDFLVFMIRAIHDSKSVPGISNGWNHLLVWGETVFEDIGFEEKRGWGPMDYMTIARAGYLVPATAFKNPDRNKQPFFLQVEPQPGRELRQTEQYARWLKEGRYYSFIAVNWLAEFVQAEASSLQPIAPGVFCVAEGMLKQRISRELSIDNLFQYGFARRANSLGHKKVEDGSLYISTDPKTLAQWMASNQRLHIERWEIKKQPLAIPWQEQMQKRCTRQAAYIPDEFQPVFLMSETAVRAVPNELLSFSELTALGHLVFQYRVRKDDAVWYAYFPNAATGKAFRKYIEAHPDYYDGTQMIRWLAEQLRERVRATCADRVTVHEYGDCCRIRYAELEKLADEFPPLNINSFKRNGYVIDAIGQKNKTSRAFGAFLVPLGSEPQALPSGAVDASETNSPRDFIQMA